MNILKHIHCSYCHGGICDGCEACHACWGGCETDERDYDLEAKEEEIHREQL